MLGEKKGCSYKKEMMSRSDINLSKIHSITADSRSLDRSLTLTVVARRCRLPLHQSCLLSYGNGYRLEEVTRISNMPAIRQGIVQSIPCSLLDVLHLACTRNRSKSFLLDQSAVISQTSRLHQVPFIGPCKTVATYRVV